MIKGLVIAVLTATNGQILKMSSEVMSEIPYLALSLATLLLWTRAERREDPVSLLLAFLALWATLAVRTAGLSLVAGLTLWMLFRKRWFNAALLVAIGTVSVLLVGGWIYVRDMLLEVNPYHPGPELTAGAIWERVSFNAVAYGGTWIPKAIVPIGTEWVAYIPTLLVLWWIVARWRTLPALYLFCYFGMLLAWPQVWTDVRFVVPVIPLFYLAVWDRAVWVRGWAEAKFEQET